jgi:hypothetical protein
MEGVPVSPDEEKLESLLREGLAQAELSDNGFTARVLAHLPPARSIPRYRVWLALGWAGSLASVCIAFGACLPWSEWGDATSMGTSATAVPAYAWTAFALAVTVAGGGVAWFFRESGREA